MKIRNNNSEEQDEDIKYKMLDIIAIFLSEKNKTDNDRKILEMILQNNSIISNNALNTNSLPTLPPSIPSNITLDTILAASKALSSLPNLNILGISTNKQASI